ncbi:putative B3 domain-containing protein At4g03170 [Hibiscus syriacus]|uniref:putative B3 domain-containing protein At4g03170 n=1 Tax=Hibiscus syriacus TaxID=106335 RepID=UPI001923EAA3|nr:putative B3 domain-containing protein At4g03170 [Hibiscus syriacus]
MKQELDKHKSKVIDNDDNGEDRLTYEVYSAASFLILMKHEKLDERAKLTLNKKKKLFLGGQGKQEQEEEASSNIIVGRNKRILDGYEPPFIPPIAALAGIITECSKPHQKRLTETDLKRDQSRLLLCKDHVKNFMIPSLKEDENVRNGIPVMVFDSEGNGYNMIFKLWGSNMYVLTSSGWLSFCRQHRLEKYVDIVTVWMFRHGVKHNLCFVITTRRSPPSPTIGKAEELHKRSRKRLRD